MTIMSRRTSTAADTPAPFAKWAPLAVILCGTFVFVLDFFVVDVALPSIQRDLGAGPGAIEWVVAGYGLTSASFLVVRRPPRRPLRPAADASRSGWPCSWPPPWCAPWPLTAPS